MHMFQRAHAWQNAMASNWTNAVTISIIFCAIERSLGNGADECLDRGSGLVGEVGPGKCTCSREPMHGRMQWHRIGQMRLQSRLFSARSNVRWGTVPTSASIEVAALLVRLVQVNAHVPESPCMAECNGIELDKCGYNLDYFLRDRTFAGERCRRVPRSR